MSETTTKTTKAPDFIQDWVQTSSTYSQAWKFLKNRWKLILKFAGMAGILLYAPELLLGIVYSIAPNGEAGFVVMLLRFAISIWQMIVSMGVIVIFLKLIRENRSDFKLSFADFLSVKDKFWTFLWANIKYSLLVILGFFLLIIPGIIWSIKYLFVPFLVLDKSLNASEAFKASAEMTAGIKWKLIGFSFIGLLIVIAGLIALGIGLFIAIPVTYIANFMLYDRLLKKINLN